WYTRPSLRRPRSARRLAVEVPTPVASGQRRPACGPTTGSSWVIAVIAVVTGSAFASGTCTCTSTSRRLAGQSSGRSTVAAPQSGGVLAPQSGSAAWTSPSQSSSIPSLQLGLPGGPSGPTGIGEHVVGVPAVQLAVERLHASTNARSDSKSPPCGR